MTIISFIFGALLNLVGLTSFFLTGAVHPHSLFPCLIGLLLILCATIARDPKFHRQAMKGSALIALVGLGGTASSALQLPLVISKHAHPMGVLEITILSKLITLLLCLIFLTRCFQEELVARHERKTARLSAGKH